MLEKTLENPLDCKEIKPVNPKGNQSWIFIGRTDAEAEVQLLWPPDAKSWLIRKDPDAGKDWRHEKGTTEDKMVGWLHQLSGNEFEQALGDSEEQGSLMCCSPQGCKIGHDWATEQQASALHFLRQEIGGLQLRNLQTAPCLVSEMEIATETGLIANFCLL